MELAFLPKKEFMLRAIELAQEAAECGEIPVGAVVVRNGAIIGEGRNRREETRTATAHAEILAIEQACRALGDWRLSDCELYVTLEPCPMCTGAILNAHLPVVVYGADDDRAGCCGSAMSVHALPIAPKPLIYRGFYEAECKALLREFFKRVRGSRASNKY